MRFVQEIKTLPYLADAATLTYTFIGSGSAEGINRRAPLNMTAWKIVPDEMNVDWKTQSAALNLAPSGCFGSNSVVWAVESAAGFSMIGSDHASFVFSPTNSIPGEYVVSATSTSQPTNTYSCVVNIIKVDIAKSALVILHTTTNAALSLAFDSFLGSGDAIWTSVPAGIEGSGTNLVFNPNALEPGAYTIRAESSSATDAYDECVVRIIKLDIAEEHYGVPPDAMQEKRVEVAAKIGGMELSDLCWEITPKLSNGARLHGFRTGGIGGTHETYGMTSVCVSGGVATNQEYTIKAHHKHEPEIYDTATIHVYELVFTDAAGATVGALKAGKWNNAFDSNNAVKSNFIDLDPDRFFIKLRDISKAGLGSVTVELSTDSDGVEYDDGPTELTLMESPANSGVFWSQSQLLVADEIDNNFTNSQVPPNNAPNDRTHLTSLGGKVLVSYAPAAGASPQPIEALVSPDYKTVEVNLVIFRDAVGGEPVIPVNVVESYWKIANERYAQIGVKIAWNGPIVVDPPPDFVVSNGLHVFNTSNPKLIHQEAKGIIDNLGTATANDINVIYVDKIHSPTPGVSVGGAAIAKYYFNDAADEPYTHNVFMDKMQNIPWGGYVGAHELGHLLTNGGHLTTDK